MSTSEVWQYCKKYQTKRDGFKLYNMVADQKKFNRIGRIVWSAQIFMCGQNWFYPLPYYHITILSSMLNNIVSFSVTNLKVWQNNFTKVCYEVDVFFTCQARLKPYNLDKHFIFFENVEGNCLKLEDQHCDSSESRAKFCI